MVLIETNQGVLAVGGLEGDVEDTNFKLVARKEILQLVCLDDQIQNCEWEEMQQKLELGRSDHVVIPLPESYNVCSF